MRVVLLVDYAHVNGGVARVAIDSALGLRARGVSVDYVCAVGPVDPRLTNAGVRVHLTDQPDAQSATPHAFGPQWLWNGAARRLATAVLADCDPRETIVHVHGWAKALSPAIGRALGGFAVVHTLHDYYLACPNGGFYDYQAQVICTRAPLSPACLRTQCDTRTHAHKLARAARFALMRRVSGLLARAPHIILISAMQRAIVAPHLPAATSFYRLDNPIDVAAAPFETDRTDDFLFVGRLAPEKGPRLFAEAARRAGVRAAFVGDGPLAATLAQAYPEARFHGWLTADETRAQMRRARALVFPSLWYEGQPLAVHEALACGAPVIVAQDCAGREAVVHGANGLWFATGAVHALAGALTELKDASRAHAMGAEAYRRYWAQPLTRDRHCAELHAIYRAVRDAAVA